MDTQTAVLVSTAEVWISAGDKNIRSPLVAKCLQTDLIYFRILYGVTDTDFNCFEMNYGVTDTDLALLIPYLIIGYRHVIPNDCRKPFKMSVTRSVIKYGMSVTRSVMNYGNSVTMSVIWWFSGLQIQTLIDWELITVTNADTDTDFNVLELDMHFATNGIYLTCLSRKLGSQHQLRIKTLPS